MRISARDEVLTLEGTWLPIRVYAGTPVLLDRHWFCTCTAGSFVSGSLDMGQTVSTLLAEAGAIVLSQTIPSHPARSSPKLWACYLRPSLSQ